MSNPFISTRAISSSPHIALKLWRKTNFSNDLIPLRIALAIPCSLVELGFGEMLDYIFMPKRVFLIIWCKWDLLQMGIKMLHTFLSSSRGAI